MAIRKHRNEIQNDQFAECRLRLFVSSREIQQNACWEKLAVYEQFRYDSSSSRSSLPQLRDQAVVGVDDRVGEVALGFLQLEHFFFDRVLGDQAIREDLAGLADAVGAVDGLRFDRGVPPGIEQEDVIGRGQIQAEAAGFQADEEQLAVRIVLELLDARLAIAGFAVEVFVGVFSSSSRCATIARKLVNCEKTSALCPSSSTSSSCGRSASSLALRSSTLRSCRSGRDGRPPGAGAAALRAPGSSTC